MSENIRKLNKFGNYLADEARKISLYYFKKKIKIVSKQDEYFDPVTIADIDIQEKLHKLIEKSYPLHSMLGEEESIIKDSEYEWCIDPIDGTKSFIQGVPLWGTLISLSKNNKIILGIADIPALDERYIGYENIYKKIIKTLPTDIDSKTIAILGLTFKPNTDDMRDSPSLDLIPKLIEEKCKLKVFDPEGMEEAKKYFADISNDIVYCNDAYETTKDSDALVILTEWNQFRALDLEKVKNLLKNKIIIDLRNIYNPKELNEMGFKYYSIGRDNID